MGVSYAMAFIIGTFLQCILYGIFVALFTAACYVQWEKFSHRRRLNRVMAFTTLFLGLTITTDCVLLLYRAMRAIFYSRSIYESLDPPYPTEEIFRWVVFKIQLLVADIIMVYRMFHIYDKNPLICIVPSITIPALIAIGCGLTNQLRDLTTPRKQKAFDYWNAACFCVTIFNNLFTTIAISFRLWGVHRGTAEVNLQVKHPVVLRAMKVLIDSAALWTALAFMSFIAFLAGSNLKYTFLAMTGPTVGIAFCMIIVRLGQVLPIAQDENWHIRTPVSVRTPVSDRFALPFTQVKAQRDVFASDLNDYPMGVSEFSKQEYVNPSDGSSTIIRASLDLPTPA